MNRNSTSYIDLESSNFIKDDTWVEEYCKIAIDLNEQRYDVFVSSHKPLREYLSWYQEQIKIIEIFPDISMKDIWLKKLEERYHTGRSEKNLRAYEFMKNNIESSIEDMKSDNIIRKLIITANDNIMIYKVF